MDLIKVERAADVVCQKFNSKEEVVVYMATQRVEIQQEPEGGTFTTTRHNGEVLLMSVENLQKLYALIGGALGEYYNELAKSVETDSFVQVAGRVDRSYGDMIGELENKPTVQDYFNK